jgi:hypothetical protein
MCAQPLPAAPHPTHPTPTAAPGLDQDWHMGAYSCNGFGNIVSEKEQVERGGRHGLWTDVLARHETAPLHLMVGGGDQLYCDDVWKVSLRRACGNALEGAHTTVWCVRTACRPAA